MVPDGDEVKAYECPECGDRFTSADTDTGIGNRSPCCGKFGSVATPHACPDCGVDLDLYKKVN